MNQELVSRLFPAHTVQWIATELLVGKSTIYRTLKVLNTPMLRNGVVVKRICRVCGKPATKKHRHRLCDLHYKIEQSKWNKVQYTKLRTKVIS